MTSLATSPETSGPADSVQIAPFAKAVFGQERVLSQEARQFLATLVREMRPRLQDLLAARTERQRRLDAGEETLRFLPETRDVRDGAWKVGPIPDDLLDRRVEITGPVDRKMIINALNSGAQVFMADFEDSLSPTWENVISGQVGLMDAVRRTISFEDAASGKRYALKEKTAVLMVRPRGLHLPEKHVLVDGEPVPAPLFDFGLFLFHNARAQIERGTGPYFYLPKLQSHREARWWDDVIARGEELLGLARGTVKVTVLIETLPAAFEMDEILYELKDHVVGLNCGRWDYIFSTIKTLKSAPGRVLPDRSVVTMTQPCMRAYTQLLVKTCHRRGAFAMGGMAAQIPIKGDDARNQAALDKVRADKAREVKDGHDGTWVAHPGLVPIALEVFDRHLQGRKNQLDVTRDDVRVTEADLLAVPEGARTEDGLRHDVRVGIRYLEAWLQGQGCVPLYDLMEDAATAEISRAQVWQWLRTGATLRTAGGDERPLDAAWLRAVVDEEMERVRGEVGDARFAAGRFVEAKDLFLDLSTRDDFVEFLTLPAYDRVASSS